MIQLYVSLFAASFTFVFLKAFQQRNVAFDNYVPVIPISIAMAAMETFTIIQLSKQGWHIGVVLAVGLAAGLGAIGAMLLHKHFFMKETK